MELLKVELQDELFESLDERDIEVVKISNYIITFFVNRGKLISKGQLIAILYKINKELMLRYGHQGDILSNIMCYDIISDDLVIPLLDKIGIYDDDEYLSTVSQKHDSESIRKRGRNKDLLKLTSLTMIQLIDDILHDLNKNDKLQFLPHLISNSHNTITTKLDPRLIYGDYNYPCYRILFGEYLREYYAEIGV